MKPIRIFSFSLMLMSIGWLSSCKKQQISEMTGTADVMRKKTGSTGFVPHNMVLLWNENVSSVIRRTGAPPPVHSRHFTMVQIAVHNALNCIKPKYNTYGFVDYRVKNADPDAAVASAAYWTLKNLDVFLRSIAITGLPLQTAGNDWDGWYASSLSGIPDGDSKEAGIALGKKMADAIMELRNTDNFKEAGINLPVTEVNPPMGVYRATTNTPPAPTNIKGLPRWGTLMRPFAMISNDQFRPAAPPSLTSETYTTDYNEVKLLGANTGSTRNADQSEIANFWQETSVNIWNRFCRNVAASKKMDAWRTARFLAMANVGIFDGFLSSFEGIYYYYRWRPETAIRLAAFDNNPATAPIENWLPFVIDIKVGPPPHTPTPPIPEYPNPQAVVGAAVVKILQHIFETDETNVDLISWDVLSVGITRHYTSFSQAGQENFDSRIYAGFHFRYSMNAGNAMGEKVGEYVFANYFMENDD